MRASKRLFRASKYATTRFKTISIRYASSGKYLGEIQSARMASEPLTFHKRRPFALVLKAVRAGYLIISTPYEVCMHCPLFFFSAPWGAITTFRDRLAATKLT